MYLLRGSALTFLPGFLPSDVFLEVEAAVSGLRRSGGCGDVTAAAPDDDLFCLRASSEEGDSTGLLFRPDATSSAVDTRVEENSVGRLLCALGEERLWW